jgi:putative membrane protein
VTVAGDGRPRRLHPLSVPVRISVQATKLIVPFLVAIWLASGSSWERWAILFILPVAIFETYAYFTTTYRITAGEVVVTRGLIYRNERHIPFARVQNIDLVQNPIERMLRLAEVRLETASGKEPEAILRDLSLDAVAEMRRRVLGERAEVAPAPATGATEGVPESGAVLAPAPRTLVHLRTRDLVAMGLTSLRGMAIVGILAGAAWEFDLFDRFDVTDHIESWWRSFHGSRVLMLAPLIALAAIACFMVLSVGWTILRLHGFRLERRGEDLRLQCGLLTKRTATIPRRRIQFVSVRATLPQRWLRRVSIRVETAGGAGEKEEDAISRRWFVPWLPASRVREVLAEVRPDFELAPPEWRATAPRTKARMMRIATIAALLVTLVATAIVRPWGALVLVIALPLSLWHAAAAAGVLAYARTARGIAFRSGVWTRSTSATLYEKVQVVALSESPFDRRWKMATLSMDTAGAGPAGHRIRIPFLERAVAAQLSDEMATEAGRALLRWR